MPKGSSDLQWVQRALRGLVGAGNIVPEQKSAAEDQQCEEYWGPSPDENSSQPNTIYHHRTLRDPGFMEKKYREKLAPDARPKMPGSRPAHPPPDWFKASKYLNI
jgi:hypothetical protein